MGNQSVLLCLSAAGRLSALERVRSERFHCNLATVAGLLKQQLQHVGRHGTTIACMVQGSLRPKSAHFP